MIDGIVDAEETVVDLVEPFHLDGLVLGVMLLKVERELLLDLLGVDGGRDFLPSLVEHRQHGVVHIIVKQHDTLLGRADEVRNEGVGVEDLPVEENALLRLLTCIKATKDLIDALVGNDLVLFDVFKTLEDGRIGNEEMTHGDKCIHDLDADINGSIAVKNRRKHRYPLLGEGVWERR